MVRSLKTFSDNIHTYFISFNYFIMLYITFLVHQLSSTQFSCSVVSPWTTAHQASPSITNSRSLLKLMSIESVMPSNHLILCCSLLFLPSIFLRIRIFSNESALHIRWPKYWSFSFNISPSNEHSALISFRMDWLDLLAVQGTLKSFLQHHGSKDQFFCAQLSVCSNSHTQGKEMQKSKMVVWGGLTKSCEKRSQKQRRKRKTYPFKCRVPKNTKER